MLVMKPTVAVQKGQMVGTSFEWILLVKTGGSNHVFQKKVLLLFFLEMMAWLLVLETLLRKWT